MAQNAGVELRSRSAIHKSFVRFFNNTERKVDVVWINFEGQHVKYKTLLPGNYMDANTYVTHPWLFIDSETQDRLVVKSEEVFKPEPWYSQYQGFTQAQLANQRVERTHVYITIPLFTLRQRALQVVRNNLSQPEDAYKLELPVPLQRELATMVRESNQTRFGIATL